MHSNNFYFDKIPQNFYLIFVIKTKNNVHFIIYKNIYGDKHFYMITISKNLKHSS